MAKMRVTQMVGQQQAIQSRTECDPQKITPTHLFHTEHPTTAVFTPYYARSCRSLLSTVSSRPSRKEMEHSPPRTSLLWHMEVAGFRS